MYPIQLYQGKWFNKATLIFEQMLQQKVIENVQQLTKELPPVDTNNSRIARVHRWVSSTSAKGSPAWCTAWNESSWNEASWSC